MATVRTMQWGAGETAEALTRAVSGWLALPFDGLRVAHAFAVKEGWVSRSLLASRDFERSVVALERAALGPFARSV